MVIGDGYGLATPEAGIEMFAGLLYICADAAEASRATAAAAAGMRI